MKYISYLLKIFLNRKIFNDISGFDIYIQEFHINAYDIRYRKSVLSTQYFYLCDEVYYWRNNYEIQEFFNTSFSDVWCEYKKKYEVINSGYYPIVDLLDKMQSVDSDFAMKYNEGTENIFYESNW